MTKEYAFKEKLWLHPGKAGWYFITLPIETAKDIDYFFSMQKGGWGSLKVKVVIGNTTWQTSIFPDRKSESYLLPIKAEVRKKEQLVENELISVLLTLKS